MSQPSNHLSELTTLVNELTKRLIDDGKLIEAGFASLRIQAIPKDAPDVQITEMRLAFFAGAQHLWGTVMNVLEDGAEATDNDLRRMDLIDAELRKFLVEVSQRLGRAGTKGTA